jgi:hypothetical protein
VGWVQFRRMCALYQVVSIRSTRNEGALRMCAPEPMAGAVALDALPGGRPDAALPIRNRPPRKPQASSLSNTSALSVKAGQSTGPGATPHSPAERQGSGCGFRRLCGTRDCGAGFPGGDAESLFWMAIGKSSA